MRASIFDRTEHEFVTTPALLFSEGDLSRALGDVRERAVERLETWGSDSLLSTPEADVIASLLDFARAECPKLDRADVHLLEPAEVLQEYNEFGYTGVRRVTQFTLVVPYEGNREVFFLRPSSYTLSPPRAVVLQQQVHVFSHDGGGDPAAVKRILDDQLNEIERFLEWARNDIGQHNRAVEAELPRIIAARRTKLLADRELHASIGFPIKRREDADRLAVPLRPREIRPQRQAAAATEPFKPEPALLDADYEAALKVIRSARNTLERNPSTTRQLGEEEIRNLLLMNLNTQFEGAAAGEVFNGAGKTDILIRVDDRNVFIGECKFWKGPKTIPDALDQLLGYLVWRDTKAALLLFIRDAEVTSVMAKAVAKVEEHPNYKRKGKHASDERHDFVLHATGDPTREIHLALLPFVIGAKE